MVNIKINNKQVVVKEGTRIIEVSDCLQIHIPRFCYHEKLSVAANCRMCLVEVVGTTKLLPACSTWVSEGMEIFTNSSKTIESQKSVMELLLANHPLDCPICDQAGECELQDLSLKFGRSRSRYQEPKRVVIDQNLGPLIATNMTRCIHCTRCVRFSAEIAGDPELAAIGKGECMQIATFPGETVNSELSGNIIDLCPVGALTAKPLIYNARSWQFKQIAGVSSHDCLGSNIYYHVFNQEIKRIVPNNTNLSKDESIWLSDRDRFGFIGINAPDRLKHPLLKKNNKWSIVTWQEALSFIKNKLAYILSTYGPSQLGGLLWPNATLEEYCLIKQLFNKFGSSNLDYRLRQLDFRRFVNINFAPKLGLSNVSDLAKQKIILLIGCHINKEQPIASTYLRTATLIGSKVIVINPVNFKFNFEVFQKHIPECGNLLLPLIEITRFIISIKNENLNAETKELLDCIDEVLESSDIEKINRKNIEELKHNETNPYFVAAESLLEAKESSFILLGYLATTHPEYSIILMISRLIALLTNSVVGSFSDGSNSAGAYLTGCFSCGENSLNSREMLKSSLKAYFLLGIEPELDCVDGLAVVDYLRQADLVVALSCFESDLLMNYADVLLPMAAPQESSGTYINITNNWKQFVAAAAPPGDSKTVTEIINILAKQFGWDFSTLDVKQMIAAEPNNIPTQSYSFKESLKVNRTDVHSTKKIINYKNINTLIRIMPLSLYAIDPIIRRVDCLQKTKDAVIEALINQNVANYFNLNNGEMVSIKNHDKPHNSIRLPIKIDNIVADGCILMNQVNTETLLGIPYSRVTIEKVALEKNDV